MLCALQVYANAWRVSEVVSSRTMSKRAKDKPAVENNTQTSSVLRTNNPKPCLPQSPFPSKMGVNSGKRFFEHRNHEKKKMPKAVMSGSFCSEKCISGSYCDIIITTYTNSLHVPTLLITSTAIFMQPVQC